jgi:hypothetical protein
MVDAPPPRAPAREAIRLGEELLLRKRFVPVTQAGATPGIARFRPRAAATSAGLATPVPEQYQLQATGASLELENEALAQLYLVFGGPGSGKSHFFMHVLQQLADHGRWNEAWGGLILDPKGTLADRARRTLGDQIMALGVRQSTPINLLRCHLAPHDLGVALALAGQAAGVGGNEPYWINQLKLLFGAGLAALDLLGEVGTLRALAEMFLLNDPGKPGRPDTPKLGALVEVLKSKQLDAHGIRRRDRISAVLSPFLSGKGENHDTTRTFLQQVLSPFLDPDLDHLSAVTQTDSVADLIFRDARWIVLDLPKTSLSTSKFISTLVKILFQQAALYRKVLYPDQGRRVFMLIDEYAEMATDLPGEGFGDSIFFSQMREFKVLSLIATQGQSMLENSAIKEAWQTILTNSSGKLVFRLNDPDTADLAAKQVGERDFLAFDSGTSRSADSASSSSGQRVERRGEFASGVFMGSLDRGQFAFLGSPDAVSRAHVKFGLVK